MKDYQDAGLQESQLKPIFCNDLYWEPQACRRLLSYDESLERVRKAGYERHPQSTEVMQVLKAGLEGKLTGAEELLFQDMYNHSSRRKENSVKSTELTEADIGDISNPSPAAVQEVILTETGTGAGEWISEAIQVTRGFSIYHLIGHKIAVIVHRDPEGLVYKYPNYFSDEFRGKYVQKNFTCTERRRFDLVSYAIMHLLNGFPEAFIEYLYGGSYNDLPKEMQRVCDKMGDTKRWLPQGRGAHPLAYHTRYLDAGTIWIQPDDFAVSRGVSR